MSWADRSPTHPPASSCASCQAQRVADFHGHEGASAPLRSAPCVSPVARQAHVQGTVVIEAIIDDKGNVTQVKAISGPGLLTPAALKAVSARKYQPTLLDGQPVSIRF